MNLRQRFLGFWSLPLLTSLTEFFFFLKKWFACRFRSLASWHSAPVSFRLYVLRSTLQRRELHIHLRSHEMWRNDPVLLVLYSARWLRTWKFPAVEDRNKMWEGSEYVLQLFALAISHICLNTLLMIQTRLYGSLPPVCFSRLSVGTWKGL